MPMISRLARALRLEYDGSDVAAVLGWNEPPTQSAPPTQSQTMIQHAVSMGVIITEPRDSAASGSSRGEIVEFNKDDRHVAADMASQTAVADSNIETQLMLSKPIQTNRVNDIRACVGIRM